VIVRDMIGYCVPRSMLPFKFLGFTITLKSDFSVHYFSPENHVFVYDRTIQVSTVQNVAQRGYVQVMHLCH
jgi:hypothetical protein